ncbi:Sua5/YciO/YrdC/YwlC family protein, partial [Patescibacteria group bacterium]|nr:Sua5/YciO/YrdC/YwlC family protein [Patescibacteria group bacterium]
MKILKISSQNKKEVLEETLFCLEKGGVVIFPTDTVYGLLADATNKEAVDKIFKIKKRTIQKPVPIFIKDMKMAKKFAKIDKEQEKILKLVWPGRVTAVLERRKKGIKLYGADKKT